MERCPKHPKYTGQKELKSENRKKCKGCLDVRQNYLESLRGTNKQGKGSLASLTTPDFNAGIVHLLVEMAVLVNFGPQEPFFWRAKSNTPKQVKDFYKKYYPIFQRQINQMDTKPLYNIIFKTVMSTKAEKVRNNMKYKYEKRVEKSEYSKIMDILESDKPIEGMFDQEKSFWDEE